MNTRLLRPAVWLPPLLAGAALLLLWEAAIAVFDIKPYLLPSPRAVAGAIFGGGAERALLFEAARNTASSALAGFAAAVAGGAIIALLLASSRRLKAAVYPWVLVLQMAPVVALVPIFVIWFGAGPPSIMAISFLISFFPVVAGAALGLASTDRALLELFAVNQATKTQELLLLRLPFALPYFLNGVKIAATLAPIGAISGEFLAGTRPDTLGYILVIARANPNKTPEVFAVVALACVVGFLFVGAVQLASWLLLRRWHESERGAD